MSPKKEPKKKASRKAYAGSFPCLLCGKRVDRHLAAEHAAECTGMPKKLSTGDRLPDGTGAVS